MSQRDERLRRAYDPEAFRASGHALVDRLADYLARALAGEALPVMPWAEPDDLAAAWPADFTPEGGVDLGEVLGRVMAAAVHQHHPRYLGHQVAVPLPAAALSELATTLLNNGMAAYEAGPVSSALERNVVGWMAAALGYPRGADGFLASGGTLGNLTALLALRQACSRGDAWADGHEPLAVLVSDHAHYSIDRAVRVMGWGRAGMARVPVDAHYRLRVDRLDEAQRLAEAAGRRVVAVVANACASATGAIDPLGPIADYCADRGLWLHVDGAHGAAAVVSSRYRHLVSGIERADSVVWDAHKLLGLPSLITALVFRDGARSFGAFRQRASYLFEGGRAPAWYDLGQRNLECTKRMMSVTLFATLSAVGTQVLDDYVTRQFDLARSFAAMVSEAPDFELAVEPECNIVCFRYRGSHGDEPRQDEIRQRIMRQGDFYLVQTELDGRLWLRVTLMNPFTEASDLEALLAAIRAAAKK
jgi:L-2,4-diaminobutyrate decarboxylase